MSLNDINLENCENLISDAIFKEVLGWAEVQMEMYRLLERINQGVIFE